MRCQLLAEVERTDAERSYAAEAYERMPNAPS